MEAYNALVSPLLPLFPLDLVLLPETQLPLHIFEPRYKEMIGECLRRKELFGVVRATVIEEGEAAATQRISNCGCTAEIVDVLRTYPDGRLDILALGRERFEVISFDEERSFLRGEVGYFCDDPQGPSADSVSLADMYKAALELHNEMVLITDSHPGALNPASDTLSFHLAGALPIDMDLKQSLLEMRSEQLRMRTLLDFYAQAIPKLKLVAFGRKKAGGNGWVN